MIRCLVAVATFVLALHGGATWAATGKGGRVAEFTVPAKALRSNLLGDPPAVRVAVYVPPSYDSHPDRRFPSLYLLHGYLGDINYFGVRDGMPGPQGMQLPAVLDEAIAKGIAREMIVIAPEARNAYFGSFYVNSALTGQWEDAIARELVPWIDARYRTIAAPQSRGVAGHSMGGYGSIMLAMKNPDVFGALYALSPCCIGLMDDLGPGNTSWAKAIQMRSPAELTAEPRSLEEFYPTFFIAMAAAFSPDPAGSGLRVRLPVAEVGGRLVESEPARSAWKAAMPLYLVEQFQKNLKRLNGIYLDVGEHDDFAVIRNGTRMLSAELASHGIPHVLDVYAEGDHDSHLRKRIETKLLPFFSEVLARYSYADDLIDSSRVAAQSVQGPLPREVRYNPFAEFSTPLGEVMDDAGDAKAQGVYAVFQVRYPNGWLMIDAGIDREAEPSTDVKFLPGGHEKVQEALEGADQIILTHEHHDHAGGLIRARRKEAVAAKAVLTADQVQGLLKRPSAPLVRLTPETASSYRTIDYERIQAIAPGVVLIKAPGHTPGSQLIYVRLASSEELLFIGDIVWSMAGLRMRRQKPIDVSEYLGEDRVALQQQIDWLSGLAARTGVIPVCAHDKLEIEALVGRGLLQAGLDSSD